MKFDPLVAQIIVAPNFDNFTTSDVRSAYLALKSDSSLVPTQLASAIPIATIEKADDKHALLLSKLNHYKAELLLNMGESEAYKELYLESPELVDELQPQYNKARDNNTRILGKIRAIEGLLKQNEALDKI